MSLYLTSYLQAFIQSSNPLSRIILERSLYTKHKIEGPPKKMIINQTHLNSVLLGPYQPFFQRIFHASSTLEHLKQQMSQHSESIFKGITEETNTNISQSHLNKISLADIDRLEKNLSNKINQHNEEYTSLFTQWCEQIESEFKQAGLQLSTTEIEDFRLSLPINELLESVTHAKIPRCGLNNTKHYDFKHYFTLKIKYVIHNYLNKMHEPIEENTIEEKTEQYNSILSKIHKEEVTLLKQIHTDYEDILKSISYAKKHKTEPQTIQS